MFAAALLLTFVVRFFHYALFYETLLSLRNFIVDYIVVAAACALGFWTTRVRQMVEQYPWAYERGGLPALASAPGAARPAAGMTFGAFRTNMRAVARRAPDPILRGPP